MRLLVDRVPTTEGGAFCSNSDSCVDFASNDVITEDYWA